MVSIGQVGMDEGRLDSMEMAIGKGEYPNIHSVLISKDNQLVSEHYFEGKALNYNGGTTQFLAAIIQSKSGLPRDEYADKYLFNPLGLQSYEWNMEKDSESV